MNAWMKHFDEKHVIEADTSEEPQLYFHTEIHMLDVTFSQNPVLCYLLAGDVLDKRKH